MKITIKDWIAIALYFVSGVSIFFAFKLLIEGSCLADRPTDENWVFGYTMASVVLGMSASILGRGKSTAGKIINGLIFVVLFFVWPVAAIGGYIPGLVVFPCQ